MGLLDKFKNLFTEEVDDDVVEQVIEPARLKQEPTITVEKPVVNKPQEPVVNTEPIVKSETTIKKEEPVVKNESLNTKKEEKFVFPVYFDDKDFNEVKKKEDFSFKRPAMQTVPKKETGRVEPRKDIYNKKVQETPVKKVFKPTPIISPVYGILDKNYYKEDIVVSNSSRNSYYDSSKPVSVDDVRKKAFGTLEDDLEKNLFTESSVENDIEENKNENIFDETDFANAVEEDKKRDLTKDNLKADIEALLDNKEFAEEFKHNILRKLTSIEKDIKNNKEELNVDVENDVSDFNEEISNLNGQTESSEISELVDDEKTSNVINDEIELENTTKIKSTKVSKNKENNSKDQKTKNLLDEELLLGDEEETKNKKDKTIDLNSIEIDSAYSDENNLNESDLFNLIDSMYEKEDK